VPPEVEELIATDGRSRSAAERADVPAPLDRSVPIEAPQAANDASTYEVAGAAGPSETPAAADGEQAAGEGVAGEESAEEAAAEGGQGATPETEAEGELQAEPEAAEAEETAADDAEQAAAGGAEEAGAEEATADWDRALGTQVYNANCVGCHQAAGQGIPGAFPPLAGHAADVYAAGGQEYLPRVLLFGLTGAIQVEGMTYNGFMPAWAQLSDDEIANVLNHVIAELG